MYSNGVTESASGSLQSIEYLRILYIYFKIRLLVIGDFQTLLHLYTVFDVQL